MPKQKLKLFDYAFVKMMQEKMGVKSGVIQCEHCHTMFGYIIIPGARIYCPVCKAEQKDHFADASKMIEQKEG